MRFLPFEYGVRSLGRSRVRLALTVAGSALVVLLLLAAGAFVTGMERTLHHSASARNVIVLGAGSEESAERSEVGAGVASLLAASIPGIETRLGVAYVSPEVHVSLPVGTRAEQDHRPLVLLRGITPAALLVHEPVQIVRGRLPVSGREELLVGRLAATVMGAPREQLALGSHLWIDGRPWEIVGEFAAPGTVMEAEIWTDRADLRTAAKRDSDSCIVLTLGDAEPADVMIFCQQRLDLELVAMTEREYYHALGAFFRPLQAVAWATAGLIALGGLLGGLSTMYAAFASRVRELATLQCLGFRRSAIAVSLVQESALAAAAGALVACAIGVLALDGLAVRFSQGAFGLIVDARVLAIALGAGLSLGVLGSLPPAWRALRMPLPEGLRAV